MRVTVKELIPHIENYLIALINTRYLDEAELLAAVAAMCNLRLNRIQASDPLRNR